MFQSLLKKVFGTKHDRQIRKVQPLVNRINELGSTMEKLEDHELKGKTGEFRQRIDKGEPLDDILPEAYAAVREAAWRTVKMKHYDVQMVGGIAMHQGKIVEMRTGEGKTLTATTAMYLNALSGHGAHLITVNDYLASRDAEWMGQVYGFLGLSTGSIVHGLWAIERQRSYRCDITYGTNNEFGFDYLRDNMKETIEKYVQRELNYAIVDEVDSILIDEARTPLIISGESDKPAKTYIIVDKIMPSLRRDLDYVVDEKARAVQLTDAGVDRIERLLDCENLYAGANAELLHHVQQALRAHTLYKKGVQYLVQNNEVVIVDEFTGRKMPGRRWSDGLHQAIEAKENVAIQPESQTLATITYQNYFRMYDKLAGMTGTADTEAEEFHQIYGLDVMVIPTHRPIARKDQDDLVYKNERGKFQAVVADIRECHERGQPVLVGTASVEKSEVLHQLLDRAGIPHNTLNAKNHGREAQIVAQAGRKHAVTVATNMAGRGTDIVLGGNAEMMAKSQFDPDKEPEKFKELFAGLKEQCEGEKKEVLALGGLRIVGTERHESRRIDNQLRGRSGRQGDPGSSQFYLSLEDDLMRIFGADRITGLMERLGMEEDVPIEAPLVNRSIENAQEKVEAMHFDTRKNLFEYDNVMNEQRKAIYALRKQILEGRYVPEILDEEARKEQRDKLPPPPETSGDHTIPSLAKEVSDRVEQVLDAHCFAVMDNRGEEVPEGEEHPFPKDGVQWRELVHGFYKVYGAVVPLQDIKKDRKAILERARTTIAGSLIQQRERIHDLAFKSVEDLVLASCPEDMHPDDWDLPALEKGIEAQFKVKVDLSSVVDDVDKLVDRCWSGVEAKFRKREEEYGLTVFLSEVRRRYLGEIDDQWIAHLKNIEHLRTGIGLVGYATRNPKNEYKIQGFNLFRDMWSSIEREVLAQVVELSLTEEQRQRALEGAEIETRLTRHAAEREAANARARARRLGKSPAAGGPGQVNPQQAAALQEAARKALAKLQGRPEGTPAEPESAEQQAAKLDDAAERAAKAAAAKALGTEGTPGGGRRKRRKKRETA